MKAILVLVTVGITVSAYADSPTLAFPSQKIETPTLTLKDSWRQPGAPAEGIDGRSDALTIPALFRAKSRPSGPSFRMPIVKARDVDSKMVTTPDDRVDYKLRILTPGGMAGP